MKAVKWSLSILFIFLCSCIVMVGRSDSGVLEDRFSTVVAEYDLKGHQRQQTWEFDEILRAYYVGEGMFRFLTITEGYHDMILLEIDMSDERIHSVTVLYQDETDHYGGYVQEAWYLERFEVPYTGQLKSVKYRKSTSEEIIAITGATVTSEAVVQSVNACIDRMEDE